EALLWISGHHLANQADEARRHIRVELWDGHGLFAAMTLDFFQSCAAGKRRLAGQREIQRAAERVNVRTRIDGGRVLCLLGGDVVQRADDVAAAAYDFQRSEEHTSELQSRGHLVCRL